MARMSFLIALSQLPTLSHAQSASQRTDDLLEQLAAEATVGLSAPVEFAGIRTPAWRRFERDLELALVWPHKSFRVPLANALNLENPNTVLDVARAARHFDDADMQRRLTELSKDTRPCLAGDVRLRTLGDRVHELITRKTPPAQFKIAENPILPIDNLGSHVVDQSITVPIAVQALEHNHLSVRVQAFAWLARYGILLNADPLIEAWELLAPNTRVWLLLRLKSSRVRTDEAVQTLTVLMRRLAKERECDECFGQLLRCLAEFRDPSAKSQALQVIKKGLEDSTIKPWRVPDLEPSLYVLAFSAFAPLADVGDVDRAMAWSRSDNPTVSYAGVCALANIDHPSAIEVVVNFIRHEPHTRMPFELSMWGVLTSREWPDQSYRWHYLRVISSTLTPCAGDMDPKAPYSVAEQGRVLGLVGTLTEMTGDPRNDEKFFPAFGFDVLAARRTAANWATWMDRHAPAGD